MADPVRQGLAVGQTGQQIEMRQSIQVFFGDFLPRNINHDAAQPGCVVGTGCHHDIAAQPDFPAVQRHDMVLDRRDQR